MTQNTHLICLENKPDTSFLCRVSVKGTVTIANFSRASTGHWAVENNTDLSGCLALIDADANPLAKSMCAHRAGAFGVILLCADMGTSANSGVFLPVQAQPRSVLPAVRVSVLYAGLLEGKVMRLAFAGQEESS